MNLFVNLYKVIKKITIISSLTITQEFSRELVKVFSLGSQ